MNNTTGHYFKYALILFAFSPLVTGCITPSKTVKKDPCNLAAQKDHADIVHAEFIEIGVNKEIPLNKDNHFFLYAKGGGNYYLSPDKDGAQGIAFRARVVDADEGVVDKRSNIFITYILGYEFPKLDCRVTLHWSAKPSVYLPHGATIMWPDPGVLVPTHEAPDTPWLNFELFIAEDPNGVYTINGIPDSVRNNAIREQKVIYNSSTAPTNPIRGDYENHGKYEGSFTVMPGMTSRLYIGLGVHLRATLPGNLVCLGCNLSESERNHLLESALFHVGSGGPYWWTESISE